MAHRSRRRGRQLYVETLINADPDVLWRVTQDPREHQRWDLRFTTIEYLNTTAGPSDNAPEAIPAAATTSTGNPAAAGRAAGGLHQEQGGAGHTGGQPEPSRFRYATTVLPGVRVGGVGVNVGERSGRGGARTSALRFASDDPRSLIEAGAGYWRYAPTPAGVRFLTGYDYVPRWGHAGRAADLVFRPLMGWATAWSFDRLRIWLERGVPPERSRWNAAADLLVRVSAVVVAAAASHSAALTAAAGAAALLVPPPPGVPAARRCRRRPHDRRAATPPPTLTSLEQP